LNEEETSKFCKTFNVLEDGNVDRENDPHGELINKNVLIIKNDFPEDEQLNQIKNKLFEIRKSKPRPFLDDKIITSWNGLMISALVRSGLVFNQKKYLKIAENVANFVLKELYVDGLLRRSYREGVSNIEGFLTDYANFIRGLIDLFEASGNVSWLKVHLLSFIKKSMPKSYNQSKMNYF
jgi:uncharacterized protein